MPGGSKKGGGLEYKPFKMKGNPFKRNFGIGETEAPDAVTPAKGILEGLQNIDLRGAAQAALSQLPGGAIQGGEETTGYQRNKDGSLKLDDSGNPIPIKEDSKTKKYTPKDLLGDVRSFLKGGKDEEKKEEEFEEDDSGATMKGTPAKKTADEAWIYQTKKDEKKEIEEYKPLTEEEKEEAAIRRAKDEKHYLWEQGMDPTSGTKMKGSPAKHGPYANPNDPSAPHGHENWKGKKKKK